MTSTNTVIIGGGQAGLATAYHLRRLGQQCLVLDAHQRVGDQWRQYWDSLRLFSPARYNALPGMRFPGDKWAYPGKDEMADYLEAYAQHFDLPIRHGVTVDQVARNGAGYVVHAGDEKFTADNVVIASGTYGKPSIPDLAIDLSPQIWQLHSSEYRRPEQLTAGPVLVVGAAHSGADIALEVATGHETILCGRDTGQMPLKVANARATRATRVLMPLLWFVANHILTTRTPMGRKIKPVIRSHGGPLLRVKRADLDAAGVERVVSPVTGVTDGKPTLEDGRVLDVRNIIWCTGYGHDYSWIHADIAGDDGWPRVRKGAVEGAEGLYFVGMKFQRAFSSMLVGGVGTDACDAAEHIVKRERGRAATPAAPSKAASAVK